MRDIIAFPSEGRFAGISFWLLAAAGLGLFFLSRAAEADVLEIGPSGQVIVHAGPEVFLTPDLRPQPIMSVLPSRSKPQPARPTSNRPSPAVESGIAGASARYTISSLLVTAVAWQESRFNSDATSAKGAFGLMQVMPSTARVMKSDLRTLAGNLEAGAGYLSGLLRRYDGDIIRSLSAYNAGPGVVDRYGGTPPFGETRAYVDAILDQLSDIALAGAETPLK